MREVGRVERTEERDLQQHIHDDAEDHRADHRERDVPFRVRALGAHLHGLLEALVGEDDAAGRHRREHAVEAEGHEAAGRVEVRAVEARHHQRDQGENGIAIFHAVIGVFDFASQRTPSRFTTVKTAISTIATA